MFCPKCGTQQTPTGRVCIKCNAPLSSTGKQDIASLTPHLQTQYPNQYTNLANQTTNSASQPNQIPDQAFGENFKSSQPQQNFPLPNQAHQPLYQPFNQPAPPPWPYQTTEQDRVKMVYPTTEMASTDGYVPGQQLQPFAQNYPISPNGHSYNPSRQTASQRAIWGLVCSILSFVFCPVFSAAIGVFLSNQELTAIEQGLAPLEGKPLAQIGYYLGLANIFLYGLGFGLFVLLVFV